MPPVEKYIGNLPGLQDRLGKDGTGIAGVPLLECVITAQADDQEKRQLQVVDDIAQGIAGFEQAGALNEHNRSLTAQQQARSYRDRLALATYPNQLQTR